jgi:HEPN domain-containing protein/predicted nucleotidyltransferase
LAPLAVTPHATRRTPVTPLASPRSWLFITRRSSQFSAFDSTSAISVRLGARLGLGCSAVIKRTSLSDPLLADITKTLVDGFHPSRIVLFGSRARGDWREESDYDLLVELDAPGDYWDVWRAVHGALDGFRAVQIDIKIRRPGEFERRRDDPGTIDYDVAREGLILHPAAEHGPIAPRSRATRVREKRAELPESVAKWLKRADDDLRILQQSLNSESPVWTAIAFHAQQAAEKYLNALVVSRWRKPPRTHELAQLVAVACALKCALPDLATECKTLERYAVDVRYPEQMPIPTEAEARAAVTAATTIVDAVRPLLDVNPR